MKTLKNILGGVLAIGILIPLLFSGVGGIHLIENHGRLLPLVVGLLSAAAAGALIGDYKDYGKPLFIKHDDDTSEINPTKAIALFSIIIHLVWIYLGLE